MNITFNIKALIILIYHYNYYYNSIIKIIKIIILIALYTERLIDADIIFKCN